MRTAKRNRGISREIDIATLLQENASYNILSSIQTSVHDIVQRRIRLSPMQALEDTLTSSRNFEYTHCMRAKAYLGFIAEFFIPCVFTKAQWFIGAWSVDSFNAY